MKLSPKQLELVNEARDEVARLQRLQDLTYSDLRAALEVDDKAGWLFDVLFNESDVESLENL